MKCDECKAFVQEGTIAGKNWEFKGYGWCEIKQWDTCEGNGCELEKHNIGMRLVQMRLRAEKLPNPCQDCNKNSCSSCFYRIIPPVHPEIDYIIRQYSSILIQTRGSKLISNIISNISSDKGREAIYEFAEKLGVAEHILKDLELIILDKDIMTQLPVMSPLEISTLFEKTKKSDKDVQK